MTSLFRPGHSSQIRPDIDPARTGTIRLSRSPHPYTLQGDGLVREPRSSHNERVPRYSDRLRPSSSSESGTEADDEKGPLLKSLPAPPLRFRKGLKGASPYVQSPLISPLLTPYPRSCEPPGPFFLTGQKRISESVIDAKGTESIQRHDQRRRAEVVRRGIETLLLVAIGCGLCHQHGELLSEWLPEAKTFLVTILLLYALQPIQTVVRLRHDSVISDAVRRAIRIPSRFDLGPLLYPTLLPVYTALSLLSSQSQFVLPNLILGLSSIPTRLIPRLGSGGLINTVHWSISCLPLAGFRFFRTSPPAVKERTAQSLPGEEIVLLYPLHAALTTVLQNLTTTSLDPAELALLSTALVNLLVFATSPEMQILKGLLWLGGLAMFVTCSRIMSWSVALARIPAWRLRKQKVPSHTVFAKLDFYLSEIVVRGYKRVAHVQDSDSEDEQNPRGVRRTLRRAIEDLMRDGTPLQRSTSVRERGVNGLVPESASRQTLRPRRNTLSSLDTSSNLRVNTDGKRQKKRPSERKLSFPALSTAQAQLRKWIYATTVYALTLVIILLPVRRYVSMEALSHHEPFGWAMSYLLGNIDSIRVLVVFNNLERWVPLPSRSISSAQPQATRGVVEHFRTSLAGGPANTRIIICIYCLTVLGAGLLVVLRLTSIVEVDTRRKVFHGIMVALLLPTTFVDPSFVSLALALILTLFLLLDLFRAAQLPPISRPLTNFLVPYVDGRDHRGPVIVSHIFLLVGCAIPLWLGLAGEKRTGSDPWVGWELPCGSRNLSMVSGVICVGMGDAAASLIGRRYGKTKWYWGGGKSLEGSLAFAIAVTCGSLAAWAWLRIGGWVPFSWKLDAQSLLSLGYVTSKCLVAGIGASLVEATLTSANDNVVVPICLWLIVRVLEI